MLTDVQTLTLDGKRFVVIPESAYHELLGESWEPALPRPDARGYLPALEAMDVSIARSVLHRRRAVGLSQAELARRAGIRPETLNRLEHGKHTPSVATVDKVERALIAAEIVDAESVPAAASRSRRAR